MPIPFISPFKINTTHYLLHLRINEISEPLNKTMEKMRTFILVLQCISTNNAFLLDGTASNSKQPQSNITDKHYQLVMDLVMEERAARRQLEGKLATQLESIQRNYISLKQNCTSLQLNNRLYGSNLNGVEKITNLSLLEELVSLPNNTRHLQLDLEDTKNIIFSIQREVHTRKDDFIALLNQFNNLKNETMFKQNQLLQNGKHRTLV